MKKVLLLACAAACLAQTVSAAAMCGAGTLASYIGLGAAGCMIGTTSFKNFQALTGTTGASPIATSAIAVTPSGNSLAPALTFSTTQRAADSSLLETIFNYAVTGGIFTGNSILLSNSSSVSPGSVSDIQDTCRNGTFGSNGVSGCTSGITGELLAFDTDPGPQSALFAPVTFISVTDDVTLDGGGLGGGGSATGATFKDSFTAVPEPGSLALAGAGMAVVAYIRRRSAVRA